MAQQKLPAVQYDVLQMQGGLDLITPMMLLKPGTLRDSLNFEANILGGYSRIGGYERYDGTALPSSATYTTIFIGSFVNVPAAGDTVTGLTSLTTGTVIETEAQYVAVTNATGTFIIGETIQIVSSSAVVGTVISPTIAFPPQHQAVHVGLAADFKRQSINAVPGSGPVRGIFLYNDIIYAFRDNIGGTSTLLYKATNSSWVNIPYEYEISFTAGTNNPLAAEGTGTLTQGAVTATLKRSVWQGGAWSGSAVGRFIISAPTGGSGNFIAGAATIGATTITLSGPASAVTMNPGGTFEVVTGNFGGQLTTLRAYGCDGTNRCWEFDGTVFTPIVTGFTPDQPKHITIHKNYLFVAVQASLGFSAPGLPYDWTALDGGGVVAVGDTITNIIELPGSQATPTMGVWTRENTLMLYGVGISGSNPFTLVPFNTGTGALHYTAENMAHTYVLDDRGIIDMQTVLNFGNFDTSTISFPVNPFIINKRSRTVGSCLNRTKAQYRLFFNDGYGLYTTNIQGQYGNGNTAYNMPVFFPNPVYCITAGKLSTGDEVIYFGSTNGVVYKLDSGSSFDGAPIVSYLTFVVNSVGAPQILKHYRHARVEVTGTSYCQFNFGYTLGYNTTLISQPNYVAYQNNINTPYWDSFTWDSFTWDGGSIVPADCEMTGTAENYAISIKSTSAIYYPYTINSIIAHYTPRRGRR